ncbi:MAG: prepilin-type N-terminal cleavage/methylation domain-containing protein [Thermoanaerobaculia bacterium]
MKKGFTLVEVLVAIFIFVLILISAYQVYERSQKTYILGEQLADLQQNIRFAYEQISYDLRRTGFNVYPDDESTRPDEQIEGMWRGAIAIRSDFDERPAGSEYNCQDSDSNRICDSETGAFLNVSTSNDEIRIYALAKKPNDPNGETISFLADLSKPRNAKIGEIGNLETIEVKGIAINQNNPPYTLYRITVDPNVNITNGQKVPQSALIWTPLASNIYSLTFTYYSEVGIHSSNVLPPDENDITSKEMEYLRKHGYPFGAAPTNFAKYVRFNLKGLTQTPDPRWVDKSDPYPATKNKRKIELTSTIVLKNVGVSPHELADTVPPDSPTNLDYTDGYCDGILLTWEPSLALDVTSYYIQVVESEYYITMWGGTWKYGCDDMPTHCYITSNPETHADGRVGFYVPNLDRTKTYYARVFSQDKAGNFSLDYTNTVSFRVNPNPIKPKPPEFNEFVEKPYNGLNRLFVTFREPQGYDDTQSSTCKEPPATEDAYFSYKIRDLYGYRIYHKRFPTSTPQDFSVDETGNLVASESTNPKIEATMTEFPDVKACPCEYYAYKMKSVTACATYTGSYGKADCTGYFLSNLSEISKDQDLNPKAYLIPEHQSFTSNPKLVPAKPTDFSASAVSLGGNRYAVSVTFPITFSVVERWDGNPPTYQPASDPTLKTECWRYKIYMYNTENDANNNQNGVEVLDQSIMGTGDYQDWDAGVDGGKEYLREEDPITFNIGEFEIPTGHKKFFRIRGYYKCASGEWEGELSKVASVPCIITWEGEISNPKIDYLTVTQPTLNITFTAKNVPADVSSINVVFRIPVPYNESFSGVCSGNPCSVTFPWNNTAYPDGTYVVNVTATDSKGCTAFFERWIVLNRTCGDYIIQNASYFNDNLTFELYKQNTSTYVLLKGISFSSSGNYLYEKIDFYESDPNSGSPTPFNLWQSATPTNMDGKWIGYDYPYPYNQSNWYGYLRMYRDPSNSTKYNWFKLNFDKNINSSNGPLNLTGNFFYKICDKDFFCNFNMPQKSNFTCDSPFSPMCYYVVEYYTAKKPDITAVDYPGASVSFSCKAGGGNCTGKVTIYSPYSELLCTNIPIFIGP